MRRMAFGVTMAVAGKQQLQREQHASMRSAPAFAAAYRPAQQKHLRDIPAAHMREPEIRKCAVDAVLHGVTTSAMAS